jgi:hypothetical protein
MAKATSKPTSEKKNAPCCERCDNQLNKEELEYPHEARDGYTQLCESCYDELFRDWCSRCESSHDKEDLKARPGELLAVWQPTAGELRKTIEPGYYRVKGWPFYTDMMFSGYLHDHQLERISALDELGLRAACNAFSATAPLCEDCRKEIETRITASGDEGPSTPVAKSQSDTPRADAP